MAGKTTTLSNQILNLILRAQPYTAPSAIWVGLTTADPTDAGLLTSEVSAAGTGYTRMGILFSAPGGGETVSAAEISFPEATGAGWGTVTHFVLTDSSVVAAGNVLYTGALEQSKQVSAGDTFVIPATRLVVAES